MIKLSFSLISLYVTACLTPETYSRILVIKSFETYSRILVHLEQGISNCSLNQYLPSSLKLTGHVQNIWSKLEEYF
jgi:hypothetical protein